MNQSVYLHQCVTRDWDSVSVKPEAAHALVGTWCTQLVGMLLKAMDITLTPECPLFFGSGFGVLSDLHAFDRVSVEQGPLYVSPTRFPDTVLNAPACRASIAHHLTGPIYNLSNGRTSALDALGLAMMHIAAGEIGEAIVCAVEEASPIARRIDPSLTLSGGAALYLSCKESGVRLYGYQKERVRSQDRPERFPAGCVEPLRKLYRALLEPKDTELVLSAQQDDCRSSVCVLFCSEVLSGAPFSSGGKG